MSNAKTLIREVDKKINSWNERSSFKIKGIGNLSMSDMESLRFYAEEYLKRGDVNHLLEQRGSVGKVLSAYGIGKTNMW